MKDILLKINKSGPVCPKTLSGHNCAPFSSCISDTAVWKVLYPDMISKGQNQLTVEYREKNLYFPILELNSLLSLSELLFFTIKEHAFPKTKDICFFFFLWVVVHRNLCKKKKEADRSNCIQGIEKVNETM